MIESILARAPARIDLAGGTLDIPPLHLFHPPACTVNVAVSLPADVLARRRRDGRLSYRDLGSGARRSWPSYAALPRAGASSDLAAGLLGEFRVSGGVDVEARTRAPRGSGLGGSSCLAVAMGAALSRLSGLRLTRSELIERVKSVETRVIAGPTGYQDYFAAAFGGLSVIDFDARGPLRRSAGTAQFLRALESRLLLVYSGVQHFSGANNWELFKRRLDGDRRIRRFFSALAENSQRMREAVLAGDLRQVAREMSRDWETRRAMIPGMSTPAIDRFLAGARRLGCWGHRVCGAGGGGCAALLAPPQAHPGILSLARRERMLPLDVRIERRGLSYPRR